MEKHDRDSNGFEELKELCQASGQPPQEPEEKPAEEKAEAEPVVQEPANLPSAETPEQDQPLTEEKPSALGSGGFRLEFDEDAFDNAPVLEDGDATVHSGGEKKPKRKKKKKRSSTMKVVLYTLSVICVSVILAAGIWLGLNDIFAFSKSDKIVQVEIERGATTKEIAQTLKEHGLIRFPLLFQFVSKMSEYDGTYQYGLYNLSSIMGYDGMMQELQKNAPKKDVRSITIVEGMTLREIAALLEENGICDGDDFVDTVNRNKFGYRFEDKVENDSLKFYRMEGYLFPDTYEFFLGEEPKSVAQKMVKNFSDKITADLYGRMNDLGWSLEKTITLASLVQAESGQSEQMRKVSSVFWNRLDNPKEFPKLQSDVTIQYVEENIKPYESLPNQEIYDAYNTYKCEGLPVGPICSPGLEAIKAALYPEDTKYNYFVTDKEGNFYYARTYSEHKKNCRTAGVPVK